MAYNRLLEYRGRYIAVWIEGGDYIIRALGTPDLMITGVEAEDEVEDAIREMVDSGVDFFGDDSFLPQIEHLGR